MPRRRNILSTLRRRGLFGMSIGEVSGLLDSKGLLKQVFPPFDRTTVSAFMTRFRGQFKRR